MQPANMSLTSRVFLVLHSQLVSPNAVSKQPLFTWESAAPLTTLKTPCSPVELGMNELYSMV